MRKECVKALAVEKVVPKDKEGAFRLYADMSMEQQRKYGIPASVTLSQMAMEIAYGESELACKGMNFFGIKVGSSWKGGKSWYDDDVPGYFRNYAMVWESIDDHSLLLMTDRYNRCRQYDSQNYHHWLVEIKRAGNASAKDYVKSYEGIIRKYWLYLYDQMAMGGRKRSVFEKVPEGKSAQAEETTTPVIDCKKEMSEKNTFGWQDCKRKINHVILLIGIEVQSDNREVSFVNKWKRNRSGKKPQERKPTD